MQPKKEFGQHFLVQNSAITAIVRATLDSPAATLLEIGPGAGVLTAPLLADGRTLHAIDLDTEAIAVLTQRFQAMAHFHLHHGDAVRLAMPAPGPFAVVGNLPYNAATAILTRFLVEPIAWERMVLMFQLEVGQKLLGKPGEKEYGPLSILAQLSCRLTRLMKLGPNAFKPPPKVDSAVLLFEPRPGLPIAQRKAMLGLLHQSFNHRRKTLANNWHGLFTPERIRELLEGEGLPPAIRAEAISPAGWLSLFHRIHPSEPNL